ncbi:MAG: hypothetical protein KME20_07980 [Kaiparowitsia implicata GSE-PSE-MK54-09C]|nr:hypothetical protein [Kaiparowitsia implicata GSE-PSE-MK54-09C]
MGLVAREGCGIACEQPAQRFDAKPLTWFKIQRYTRAIATPATKKPSQKPYQIADNQQLHEAAWLYSNNNLVSLRIF